MRCFRRKIQNGIQICPRNKEMYTLEALNQYHLTNKYVPVNF